MFKDVVLNEIKERGMTFNALSIHSGVQRDAVYRWLNNTNDSIHSVSLEKILLSLDIVVVRIKDLNPNLSQGESNEQ